MLAWEGCMSLVIALFVNSLLIFSDLWTYLVFQNNECLDLKIKHLLLMKQTIYEQSICAGINIYWHYKVQILIISYLSCFISSLATLPGMWERTVTIGSAGKTFSVTGWKVRDSAALHHFPAHTDKARLQVVPCFSIACLSFRSLYYPWGKMRDYL